MDIKEKVENILSGMTLLEKIGQLNQAGTTMASALPGFEADVDTWVTQMMDGAITKDEFERRISMLEEDLREDEVACGTLGNFVNLYEDEKIARVQQAAIKRSRQGIPLFIGVDVIRGYRTIFPTPLAMSCSWDIKLVEKMAEVAKKEAIAGGVNWSFGPMLDVAPDARWGRIVESWGEDAYLTGCFGKTIIKKFQEPDEHGEKLLATAKHFAAYGAALGGRDYNSVDMSLQKLFNQYMPPFIEAVDAGVGAVMSAFHDFNGVPCTMDEYLLNDILRERLGFDGFVVSDAEAVKQLVVHGAVADEKEAALKSILAGGDMDMSSMDYIQFLPKLVEKGILDEKIIDRAASRVLTKKLEYGLFDREYQYDPEKISEATLTKENRKAAYEMAVNSAVLLKNDGVLPISEKVKKIVVVGKLAVDKEALMGPWAFTGEKDALIDIVEGLSNACPKGMSIEYIEGFSPVSTDMDNISEVLMQVKDADLVIAVAGENAFMSGEAASKAELKLSGKQEQYLLALAKADAPVVTVLVSGRPLGIRKIKENPGINAVMAAWHLGTEFGNALGDLLFGKRNPSGRLTATWVDTAGQEPFTYNHNNTGKPGGDFKFTSKYLDAPIEPLYPFGYGLSYTQFSYSNVCTDKECYCMNDIAKITVTVENVGDRDGAEVVQLYVRDLSASIVRPVKELKAFSKQFMKAGEAKRVTLEVPIQNLGFYNRKCEYVLETGDFKVFVGHDSCQCLETKIVVTERG